MKITPENWAKLMPALWREWQAGCTSPKPSPSHPGWLRIVKELDAYDRKWREAMERSQAEAMERILAVASATNRYRHQLKVAREALREARVEVDRLSRQAADYDEDEFDPAKQRGVGAIQLGHHPVFAEVEALEQGLGMSPTVDQLRPGVTGAPLYAGALASRATPGVAGETLPCRGSCFRRYPPDELRDGLCAQCEMDASGP